MKRLLISEIKEELYLHDLFDDRSFDEAIKQLHEAKEHWHKKYAGAEDIKLSVERAGYDGGYEIYLMVYRYESDKEFEKRKAAAEKAKLAKEERERKAKEKAHKLLLATEAQEKELLKKLQAKYGEVK